MYPELFKIPFTELTVKSYGLMLVIGFLVAAHIIRRLSRNITPDPQMITNASLYCLVTGVVCARLFYVLHHFDEFSNNLVSIFKIWEGGLELLGGVIGSIGIIVLYLRYHKLPARQYLDILVIGLMMTLSFGRIGCFLNGCCFGRPCELPWAVRFPYHSLAYINQAEPNPTRDRSTPRLNLPADFYDSGVLKPFDKLTPEQKQMVITGPYRCLPVHPTELYASADAAVLSLILYLFWRRSQNAQKSKTLRLLTKPGSTFALMFILYGFVRFFEETLRDDNPFEFGRWAIYKGGTISQNIGIYMVIAGIIMMLIFQNLSPDNATNNTRRQKS